MCAFFPIFQQPKFQTYPEFLALPLSLRPPRTRIMAAASAEAMYRLPPFYGSDVPLALPTCMYSLPNYHNSESSCKEPQKETQSCEYGNLVKRQEAILFELEGVKAEVEGLASKLGVALPAVRTGPPTLDLVVSASPNNPPLSLFTLQHLLHARGKTHSTAVFVHSSLKRPVPPHLMTPFQGSPCDQTSSSPVIINLVWKEVEHDASMAVQPGHCHLHGEATIARFLCRTLLPDLYDALTVDKLAQIDIWLDVALSLACGSTKEKSAALKSVNTQLQKSQWLVGSKMTLAEVCVASSLLKTNVGAVGSLSENVKTWLKRIPGIKC